MDEEQGALEPVRVSVEQARKVLRAFDAYLRTHDCLIVFRSADGLLPSLGPERGAMMAECAELVAL